MFDQPRDILKTSPVAHPPRQSASTSYSDAGNERRTRVDRRRVHPLLCDYRWAFRGRRQAFRRDESGSRAVLDRYPAGLVAVAVAVFVLSAIDAGLTLTMIERGSVTESNPVMNVLLLFDVRLFVGSKILITGAGVISLVMYSRLMMFGRLRLRRFLNFILLFYILLIGYELTLLSMS